MSNLFLKLVNMSISASWLVLIILLLRVFLRKGPRWILPILWGIVGVRLVLPVTIESPMSLIPSADTISPSAVVSYIPIIRSGFSALDNTVNTLLIDVFSSSHSVNLLQNMISVSTIVWIAGMTGMLCYMAVAYFCMCRHVKNAVPLRDNIFYQGKPELSPFVLGLLHPRIYLPFQIPEEHFASVVAHEQTHIHRQDHWWRVLGFLLLAVYWFHPLIWVAYTLLCRDIELACDECVIRTMSPSQRSDYCQALLGGGRERRRVSAFPLTFGETDVKRRVSFVLHYKKPVLWVVAVAVAVCIAVATGFLTDPVGTSQRREVASGESVIYFQVDPDTGELTTGVMDRPEVSDDNSTDYGIEIRPDTPGGLTPVDVLPAGD